MNTGNQEIVRDEFITGMRLSSASGVVKAKPEKVSDESIILTTNGSGADTSFKANCLNANDYVPIQYLVGNLGPDSTAEPVPECKVQGATRPARDILKDSAREALLLMVPIILFATAVLLQIFVAGPVVQIIAVSILIFAAIYMCVFFILSSNARRYLYALFSTRS